MALGAMMIGASALSAGMGFMNKMAEAKSIKNARKRLAVQKDLDIRALNERMAQHTGEQTVAIAASGFEYGGSKAQMVNDTIYSFKLREAEYMNQYRLQRKAMKAQAKMTKINAFTGLLGSAVSMGASAKSMGMFGGGGASGGGAGRGYAGPLGMNPKIGSSLSQPLNAKSVFSKRPINYGIRLR
jgi:hypothetical protein